ncbi:ABC transporter permease [Bengtsoniella intestinalis]
MYLRHCLCRKHWTLGLRIFLLVGFFALWELAAQMGWIEDFIFSSPSRISATLVSLAQSGDLWLHVSTSVWETIVGFTLGTVLGIIFAIFLWWSPFVAHVLEPYLVVLSALPKTALGPIFIVWMGAGSGAIITMTLAISLIVTILDMHNGFLATDSEKIALLKTLGANRPQILFKLVLPANLTTMVNVLKVNVGLSWVGVIMGEFLVSKAGLGYLIVYGSQVFKMDLVMCSVLILALCAAGMYQCILWLEKGLKIYMGVTL